MSESYEKMRHPPESVLREIKGGRLNGKTDINPQWRYELMDAVFGVCGIGWKYEIIKLWTEPATAGQVMCFSEIKVYVKKTLKNAEMQGSEWSDAIPGIGGSMLIEQEAKGVHVSDEGFKMATTDALSVALKMLGVAADIYSGHTNGSKYKDVTPEVIKPAPISQYVELKTKIIDWLAYEPKLLTDAQRQWVNDMIQAKNVSGMQLAVEKFKQAEEKTK